jgi:hypothetical protein
MSTGAWIFSGLICAAVIAPVGVYAASLTKVALVGPGGTTTSQITAQHQLLTTQIAPGQVIHAATSTGTNTPCKVVYTPPAHKAIVVTSVVYDFGSGTNGAENFGGLFDAGCHNVYDQIDGVQAYDTIQHTYPTGLPMRGVSVDSVGGAISVFVTGYLVDSSSLPPARAASQQSLNLKAFARSRHGH